MRRNSEVRSPKSEVGVECSADLRDCRIAGFQTCGVLDNPMLADLEIGDTAGLETCATLQVPPVASLAELR